MAKFTAQSGIDPLLRIDLERGDEIAAESGSMVMMDASLELKSRTRGGFLKSIARKFLNDETFFQQWITAPEGPGTVFLAPSLPGGVRILKLDGGRGTCISDGCFLAASSGIEISTKSQSLGRALLGDSGGFFIMEATGTGDLAVSGFGSLEEVEVTPDRPLVIDNGHLVAWDSSLDYEVTLRTGRGGLAGRLVGSQLTGEGFVLRFKGRGRVILSSRSQGSFVDWIFSRRPMDTQGSGN